MKFGMIQCKKCRHALGIDLRFKSTKCPFCNLKLSITPQDIKYQSMSEKEVSVVISKFNRQLEVDKIKDAKTKHNTQNDWLEIPKLGAGVYGGDGGDDDVKVYEDLDPFKRIAMKYKNETESPQLLKKLVIDLGRELGEFTGDDLRKLLGACAFNIDKTDQYLEQLKNMGIIYEPKMGRYKMVEGM